MFRTLPIAALFAVACTAQPEAGPAYIAPLDGQTLVPEDLVLRVQTGGLDLPPDSPVDQDLIQVLDLDTGKSVRGELERRFHELRFVPQGGWREGHHYLWFAGQAPGAPRQPEQALPDAITGQATFQATEGAAVLDAGIDEDGSVCLVLSRPVAEIPPLQITLADDPVDGIWELREEPDLGDPIELLRDDPGVSLACWVDAPELLGGESLRVWWGDGGPWRFTLGHITLPELTADLRRRAL